MQHIKIGLEIEAAYNRDIIKNLVIGSYHNGLKVQGLKYWSTQEDNSIRAYNAPFTQCDTVEFVSNANLIKSKKAYIKSIEEFKRFFSQNGKHELKDVLFFDKSTGMHVHFSINDYRFNDFVPLEVLKSTRRKFNTLIKKSNISSKNDILKQYNRHYAKQIRQGAQWRYKNGRYQEFNFVSESDGKGFEWRSPNLVNIKTWSELEELLLIVFKCVEWLYKKSQKYNIKKTPLKIEEEITEQEINENVQY